MSFDYVNDLFGEYRGYETRYTPVEKHAIDVIRQYVNKEIDSKTFAETMQDIRKSFLELDRKDENGNTVIDQDVPLWLGNFLAFKFLRWYDYFAIQEAAKIKPELTQDSRWPNIMGWARHYEQDLHQAMKYCLNEWDRIHNPQDNNDDSDFDHGICRNIHIDDSDLELEIDTDFI